MSNPAGDFIWYELMTDEPESAAAFYRAVIGWTTDSEPNVTANGTDYRMIHRSDGGAAGGMLTLSPDMLVQGAKPGWMGYLYHPDVDAAVASITAAGGAVHMGPMDMPPVGRVAMVSDPQGAPFYILNPTPPEGNPDAKSDVFDPAKPQHARWNELWSSDPDAAITLYSDVFGWSQEGEMDMGPMGKYRFIQNDGVGIGAVGVAQPDGPGTRWETIFGVDDIDRALAAVRDNGGTVKNEPQQVPGGEYAGYFADPSGASFGLVGPRKGE